MLKQDGFLSSEIAPWVDKHRKDNLPEFTLVERINRLAVRDLLAAAPKDGRPSVLMMTLLGRGVASLESAIFLSERGLTADGRTAVRSMVETVIYFAAAKADEQFADELIAQDKDHKSKVARRLLAFGTEKSGLDAERSAQLASYLQDRAADSGIPINLRALAIKHGLGDIYDTFYRGLSGDAAHPTVTSLNRHVVRDVDGFVSDLKWGPDVEDVGDTLMAACGIAFHLLWWAKEAFGSPDNGAEFSECWSIYKTLVERSS